MIIGEKTRRAGKTRRQKMKSTMYNYGKPEDIRKVHCKDQFYCDKNDRDAK